MTYTFGASTEQLPTDDLIFHKTFIVIVAYELTIIFVVVVIFLVINIIICITAFIVFALLGSILRRVD